MGDVDLHEESPGVEPGGDDDATSSCLARSCLVAVVAALLAIVVLPILIWTLGIACGGR